MVHEFGDTVIVSSIPGSDRASSNWDNTKQGQSELSVGIDGRMKMLYPD